jgi:hypothetical protein
VAAQVVASRRVLSSTELVSYVLLVLMTNNIDEINATYVHYIYKTNSVVFIPQANYTE